MLDTLYWNGKFVYLYATVSSTFKRVMLKLVSSKVHKNKVAQKCVLIVRSVSDRRADEVNVWGNLISMYLEPNESEPNVFKGRADRSTYDFTYRVFTRRVYTFVT